MSSSNSAAPFTSPNNVMEPLVCKSSQIDVNADVDRLAHRLSETHLPHVTEADANGKKAWIHFPPSTTLDEQLLIRGGGEPLFQRKRERDTQATTDFSSKQKLQDATSAHLDRLPIASSSYSSTHSMAQNATVYITHYDTLIDRDWSPNTLSHAALPSNAQVLEELSVHMADEVYKRYRLGFSPTLPPLAHPYYPFWLPEHEANYAIEALVRREMCEEGERRIQEDAKENGEPW